MGALGHYLEAAGIPTTQISLIREHTEAIRPPRALWVPFELGRPLGAPGDVPLQRRVLLAALQLLEAPAGPVLADFPEDAPGAAAAATAGGFEGAACAVRFAPPAGDESDVAKLRAAFEREVAELRPWHDRHLAAQERTAVGSFPPEDATGFLGDFALGAASASPVAGMALGVSLRLAAQDLKAFYFEAATARPGTTFSNSAAFHHWFWRETAAGRLLKAVKERCLTEADPGLRQTGGLLLVPMEHA